MSDNINIVITDKNFDTKVLNGLVVKSEVNANTISIEFPKIYEMESLENKIFVIKTVNANGVYFEEILPKTISDNKIILTWKIGSEYTSVSGNLRVAIFAEGTNYTLGTKTSKIVIENSPQFTAPISPEDVFEKYLKEIRVRSESAANSAEQSLKILTDMNSKIVDDFTSTAKDKALSANKGRELSTRIENIVGQAGTSNTEIVDARNSSERNTIYPTLKGRLDAVDGDIVKSKYSAPSTATAPIISLPSTAVKGKLEGSLKGNTLYQAVVNGGFSNGTSGWTPISVTGFSVANKIAKFTATTQFGRIQYSLNAILRANNKYFFSADVKSSSNLVRINLGGNVTNSFKTHSGSGQTERLYNVYTPTADTSMAIAIQDNGVSGFSQIEVSNIVCIPISGTTYTDWTADQINNLITGYWEGLGNSKDSRTRVVGKNLFDKYGNIINTVESNHVKNETGITALTLSAGQFRRVELLLKLKPNIQYRFKCNSTRIIGTSGGGVLIQNKEKTTTLAGNVSILNPNLTFTVPSDGYVVILLYITGSTTEMGRVEFTNIMLNEGSTALPYEPYQETELFCPVELGNVPNGVADEFTFDGKYIQRTKEYVLQSGDIEALTTTTANYDYIYTKAISDMLANSDNGIVAKTAIFGSASSATSVNSIGLDTSLPNQVAVSTSKRLYLTVPKGTYANLAAAQTALAGTKIRYQLATPVETQYPASNLVAESSGTIYVDNIVKIVKPYATNITVDVKIKNLISVTKVDGETRVPVLLSLVNVAADGMSLAILNASSGDMYELEYETFGATLPTIEYSYSLNLNAQVQGNTEALKSTDKTLQDFLAYQNAVNAQVDLRLVLLERK